MPGIVQGKESLLVGLEGKVEHSWPRPGARVGPPTGNLPVYRTLPVVELGAETRDRGGGRGLYPCGRTVAERRQTDNRGQLKVPALRTAGTQGAEKPRRGNTVS